MENKLMLSLYEDEKIGLNMEMVFDIITLYGDKNIDGIEFNSYNLDRLKKCAKMCRKNNFLFRCHFPLKKLNEFSLDLTLDYGFANEAYTIPSLVGYFK